MEKKLLRIRQVIEKVGFKQAWIYQQVKAGTFPKPIKVGSASLWDVHALDAWIDERIKENERKS